MAIEGECILWTGAVNNGGYGVAHVGDTTMSAARWAWQQEHGPLPDDLTIDHLCRTPLCINTAHLEPVTRAENNRRAPRSQVTECPQGHPLSGDNLYVQRQNGSPRRSCKACRREANRRWEAKRRLAS